MSNNKELGTSTRWNIIQPFKIMSAGEFFLQAMLVGKLENSKLIQEPI